MDQPISDKKVSKHNMIFIVVATIILISLIFVLVAFIGFFRSDFYSTVQESQDESVNK